MPTTRENIIASAMEETDATIDWRKILVAYIRNVVNCEGVTFLGVENDETNLDGLTPQEAKALTDAANQAVLLGKTRP